MATHEEKIRVFEDTLAWIDSDANLRGGGARQEKYNCLV